MSSLHLAVKSKYFDQIKSGSKKEEYRIANDYWKNRLIGRSYLKLVITNGYPRKDDESRRLVFDFNGYEVKTIQHEHFGSNPVVVFAIKLSKCQCVSK